MKKLNRKCCTCSTQYRYCNSCAEDVNKPTWMAIYCSNNCRQIFLTSTDYLAGDITKEQAKESYDNCDLTNKINFHNKIVEAIDAAYSIEKTIENETTEKYIKKKKKNLDSDLV